MKVKNLFFIASLLFVCFNEVSFAQTSNQQLNDILIETDGIIGDAKRLGTKIEESERIFIQNASCPQLYNRAYEIRRQADFLASQPSLGSGISAQYHIARVNGLYGSYNRIVAEYNYRC